MQHFIVNSSLSKTVPFSVLTVSLKYKKGAIGRALCFMSRQECGVAAKTILCDLCGKVQSSSVLSTACMMSAIITAGRRLLVVTIIGRGMKMRGRRKKVDGENNVGEMEDMEKPKKGRKWWHMKEMRDTGRVRRVE